MALTDVKEGLPNEHLDLRSMESVKISDCIVIGSDIKRQPKELKFLEYNRVCDIRHITKIAESMKADGFHDWEPIICNERGEIIDGQHRLLAALLAKIQPYIIIKSGLDAENVITSNSLSKNWSLPDYVHFHAFRGNKDFQRLLSFAQTNKIAVSTALCIIKQRTVGWEIIKNVKAGIFACSDEDVTVANVLYDAFKPIIKLLPSKNYERPIKALISVLKYHPNKTNLTVNNKIAVYNQIHQKMLAYPHEIHQCATELGYVEMFIKFYNKKMSDKNKMKIYREFK